MHCPWAERLGRKISLRLKQYRNIEVKLTTKDEEELVGFLVGVRRRRSIMGEENTKEKERRTRKGRNIFIRVGTYH